jgi:hypothetical protein
MSSRDASASIKESIKSSAFADDQKKYFDNASNA